MMERIIRRNLILWFCFGLCCATADTSVPIAFHGEAVELVDLKQVDARVRNRVTERDWNDAQTVPGWYARTADLPADKCHLSHGGNPAPGIQILVDGDTNQAVALGSLINSQVKNALLAVGVVNESGRQIKNVEISLTQIQWYGGSGAVADKRTAWYAIGGKSMSGLKWQRLEALNLRNFVAAGGKLNQPVEVQRSVQLDGINWEPGETLWMRWVDVRVSGGNAGAGIASLKIVENE